MKIVSREEASALGRKHFYSGKPCKRGHISERYVRGGRCVECAKAAYQKDRERVAEREKDYRSRNHAEILERKAEYRRLNREAIRERDAVYKDRMRNDPSWRKTQNLGSANRSAKRYAERRDEILAQQAEYRARNRERINRRRAERYRKRYRSDPIFRSAQTLRFMLKRVIRATKEEKMSTTLSILGYTAEEFRLHIERQFSRGMSWDNHGAWHVDHITPMSALIADGVTDPAKINCLSNLRPIWAKDNLSKGSSQVSLL